MKYQIIAAAVLIASTCVHCLGDDETAVSAPKPESATYFQDAVRPALVTYCAACHQDNESEGAVLFLKATTQEAMAADRGHWNSVAEQLRNRTMPPADEDQPSEKQRLQISAWIEKTLRQSACGQGEYAGHVTTRRLNRVEYDNTICDLLGVSLNLSQKFPVDGSGGEGFDNNGETLFLPPLLMERYLEAATEAIDATVLTPRKRLFLRPGDLRLQGMPKNTDTDQIAIMEVAGAASYVPRILQDGTYTLRLHVSLTADSEAVAELSLDGLKAHTFRFSGEDAQQETESSDVAALQVATTLRLSRGFHTLALKNVGKTAFELARLDVVEQQVQPTESQKSRHKRIVGVSLGENVDEPRRAARKAITDLATRAFRRPVTDDEVQKFLALFQRATERGDPFEHSLKQALRAILVSPHFVFRIESVPKFTEPQPLNDYELASRLSYFLWSSMPDEPLFAVAAEGKLQDADVLTKQVDRMLKDGRSETFYEQFVGQWLGTLEVAASVVPDTGKFKGQFTTELLLDFRDEPVRLFQYIVQNDRTLMELLNPRYVVVNNRLAKHYALDGQSTDRKKKANPWSANPKRSQAGSFRRLDLAEDRASDRRGGVLGMGGVHLLTSYPTRTSPVLRGAWVLETLLGVRVPPPPPDVPDLKTSQNKKKLSAKESLALHRDNAACAACHNLMDPVGFALENFDPLGRWRDKDGKESIDSNAILPSGEKFNGMAGLRRVLLSRQHEFLRHLTEKILGYALGRSLTDRDDCTIQRITNKVMAADNKARILIREVVLSTPFREDSAP